MNIQASDFHGFHEFSSNSLFPLSPTPLGKRVTTIKNISRGEKHAKDLLTHQIAPSRHHP
jgi:hypothetical protein